MNMANKGGRRHGAGRKPDPNSVRSLRKARLEGRGTVLQHPSVPKQPSEPEPPPVPPLVVDEFHVPNDLTVEQRQFWLLYAPEASRKRTLTKETEEAFKSYLPWLVINRDCSVSVTDRGSATHDRAMKWVAKFHKEFDLSPDGRPVVVPASAVRDEDEEFFGGSNVAGNR